MILTIVGSNVMRRSSWFTAAVISPLIILVTGTMFFLLVVFEDAILTLYEGIIPVSYTHLRAHETVLDIVCRLLLEKKKQQITHPLQYVSHTN